MRFVVPAVLLASGLLLVGCAAAVDVADPGETTSRAIDSPSPSPSPTPTPIVESEFGPAVVNDHGNVIKVQGQLAGITSPTNAVLARVTVSNIQVDPGCPDPYAEAPVNGHFVVFTVHVETTPEFTVASGAPLLFNPYNWKAYGAGGNRINDPSGSASSCFDTAAWLPYEIGPGEIADGVLVWDMPDASGSLAYPLSVNGGWEWSY